jgi:tetratricopeptide (TPR) repeat protein
MTLHRSLIFALLACTGIVALAQSTDADRSYRDARRELNRQNFDEAIGQFRALRSNHPESPNVADSYYWEAFALERTGNLEGAVQALDTLLREHSDAGTSDDARRLRIQVCSELARRGNGECAADIAPVVRNPGEVDAVMRDAAMNALINMRPDRAVPIATQVLADRSQSDDVRRQALFIVADKGEEDPALEAQARATLLRTARDTTDSMEVRKQAVFWLSELRGEETLAALRELTSTSADPELLNSAIFAISQHESADAGALLRELAENGSLSVELRKQAIFWLAEEHEERAVPFLTELYGKLADTELKRQVLFAVAETEDEAALGWLLERGGDAREPLDVRKQALFWAAEAGLPAAQLRSLYGSTAEPELREHLIWLISENEGPGAVDGLIEIARTDPDPQMRKKAVFWIGESDDPRAEHFLLEILGQGGRQ